jgi:hypothetical protein
MERDAGLDMSVDETDQTEFSGDWLALREPADHAARDPDLLGQVVRRLEEIDQPRIVDLASGRGSTIAAIDPDNVLDAHWHLMDQDQALLQLARERFPAHRIMAARSDLRSAVLSRDQFGDIIPAGTDLITVSAFIDLASIEWTAHLALRCSERAIPVYCALTIDGRFTFDPVHPLDEAFLSALARHEQTNKGFGPALGPHAPQAFQAAFGRAGYIVDQAESDWKLEPADKPLIEALIEGWAGAVLETGLVEQGDLLSWVSARIGQLREGALTLSVGHKDLLARLPQHDVTKAG